RRGAVPCAEAGGQVVLRRQRFQVAACRLDDAVSSHDERAVDPGELAYGAARGRVEDRACLRRVALERIEHQRMRVGEHGLVVAQGEEQPDAPALPALVAELDAEAEDRVEDDRVHQLAEPVECRLGVPVEQLLVVPELDDGDRVQLRIAIHGAARHDDHPFAGPEQACGKALQQRDLGASAAPQPNLGQGQHVVLVRGVRAAVVRRRRDHAALSVQPRAEVGGFLRQRGREQDRVRGGLARDQHGAVQDCAIPLLHARSSGGPVPVLRQLVFRGVAPACRALALPLPSRRFVPGSTHREANVRGSSAFLRLPTFEHRLANGLTVLIREDHSAPVVAIVTHVKAGYFNEPDRLVGISHVLEHMYFKGTEQRGVGVMARETKAAGGYLNAGTIYDHTSYYTVLPSSALELGLDVQSDALRNAQIDEEELRRELLVIIQEARRKLDDPGAVAIESLYELMFDVHRMRRWRIGTEEGLRRITRADVWEYYRNLYRPSNTVLVVAGDLDPERTLALVERFYGDMPAGEPVHEPAPEEPERTGLRFREMEGDIVQSRVAWGWRTPGPLGADTPALDLLATVLGQGRASRLYRHVREAGWVSGITAANYTPMDIGVFAVSAEANPQDVPGAVDATWGAIEALRTHGAEEAELERAKSLLEARFLRRLETMEGQANLLAEWQALGNWRLAGTYLDRLLAVTGDELRRAACRWLAPDRANVLVYRPASAPALGWSATDLGARLAAAEPITGAAVPPGPAVRPTGPGVARPAFTREGEEDGVHFYRLGNGVRIAIKPRRASPLVSLGLFVRGGAIREQ